MSLSEELASFKNKEKPVEEDSCETCKIDYTKKEDEKND